MALHRAYREATIFMFSTELLKALDRYTAAVESKGSESNDSQGLPNLGQWFGRPKEIPEDVLTLQYTSDPTNPVPTILFAVDTTMKGKSTIAHLMTQYSIKTAVTIRFGGLTLVPEDMGIKGLERMAQLSSVTVWTTTIDDTTGGTTVYKAYDEPLSSQNGMVKLWFSDFIHLPEEQLPADFRRPTQEKRVHTLPCNTILSSAISVAYKN
jgi:hypothetical protein